MLFKLLLLCVDVALGFVGVCVWRVNFCENLALLPLNVLVLWINCLCGTLVGLVL